MVFRCFESVDGVFAGGRAPYGHHHQNQSRLSPARPPRPQKCSLLLRPTVLPTKVQPTQPKWLLYSVLPCCHFCSPLSKHYISTLSCDTTAAGAQEQGYGLQLTPPKNSASTTSPPSLCPAPTTPLVRQGSFLFKQIEFVKVQPGSHSITVQVAICRSRSSNSKHLEDELQHFTALQRLMMLYQWSINVWR